MTQDADRLYGLVPVVYRTRDADQGYPLRALLRVISEQVGVVERDIGGLYENWFIETCEDWVVPYIGALIGYEPPAIAGVLGTSARDVARERVTISRRDVANAIRFRRRKGTVSVLEDLAEAVGGWPARAVEFYRLLAVTQNIDHLQMDRGRTAELRDGDALLALDGAFDEIARNADVRRVTSGHARGTANIPEVGVFVWRLGAYTITKSPAYNYESVSPGAYLFSTLGNDTQLFTNPRFGADPALPRPIERRSFDPRDYGEGKSVMIWTGSPLAPVAAERIVPADLSDWSYHPLPDRIAVDPVLGRMAFPLNQPRQVPVWVSYSYGFSADLGGGEYVRALRRPPDAKLYQVGAGMAYATFAEARTRWEADAPPSAVIEFVGGVYAESIAVKLGLGQTLELRAAPGTRPVLRLLDFNVSLSDHLSVSGESPSWFVLDGLTLIEHGLQISGAVTGVTIRHCTLVPGWSMTPACEPKWPTKPSLEVLGAPRCITIEHSIVGGIQIERDETVQNPLELRISDSVLDATSSERMALTAPGKLCADAILSIRRSTVIGQIQTREIALAEDSILDGAVHACRRQHGCVRFCYLGPGSHTPRRYECQPDLVEAAVGELFARGEVDALQRDVLLRAERLRVEPEFESTRYGTPRYCRLTSTCATEISTGAEDRSELGVYHDLYEPQRVANLRRRLDEHTPAGTDAGIIFAT
jgi:hypothetical protein